MQNNEARKSDGQTLKSPQPADAHQTHELPKSRLRLGFIIFGSLASIKILEYFLSKLIKVGDWPYLALLALISAWLILYYYKHIHQLWHSGGRSNE